VIVMAVLQWASRAARRGVVMVTIVLQWASKAERRCCDRHRRAAMGVRRSAPVL
jgi:hypothetical protein